MHAGATKEFLGSDLVATNQERDLEVRVGPSHFKTVETPVVLWELH